MSADETLSLVPESGPPAPEVSTAVLVLLGLTYTGGRRPLELAFCSDHQNEQSFLVKVGARSAHCSRCRTRHRVVSLVEAAGTLAINDEAAPNIMLEDLLEPMFRELMSRAHVAGSGEPGGPGRKRSEGAG